MIGVHVAFTFLAAAAPPSASELLTELGRLKSTARVLYVAAHPDDENTRLIAALTSARHADVAYLSLTRGSGGQNRIGDEQGDLLGVLRTGELLAARDIDGGRQLFTRARDFGYSKSVDETLQTWDEAAVLDDVVRAIRTFRPDVVVTRFRETGDTHGHHLASAVLARRAVEQLEGEGGWTPKRLVLNIPTWRGEAEDAEFDMVLGEFDPVRGMTVGELAAYSRSQHRSQGFGMAPTRKARTESFRHVWGDRAAEDLLDGVDASWGRFGDEGRVAAALEAARRAFRPEQPAAMLAPLAEARAALSELKARHPEEPRIRDQLRRLDGLVARAAGLFVRASTEVEGRAAGARVSVEVEIANRAGLEIRLDEVAPPGLPRERPKASISADEPWVKTYEAIVPPGPATATPWLSDPSDPAAAMAPVGPIAMTVGIELSVEGRPVALSVPVRRVWVDRSAGELSARFERLPPVTATPVQSVRLLPRGAAGSVTFELRRHHDGPAERVRFEGPAGWRIQPRQVELRSAATSVVVKVEPPRPDADPFELRPARVTEDGAEPLLRSDAVDYPHVERTRILRPAVVRCVPLDLSVPSLRVGYVPGAGDRVAELLAEVGVDVTVLGEQQVAEGDFSGFDAIVIGVRALNVHSTLSASAERLFEWVERGGRLVFQYNTNNWFDELKFDAWPGTLEIGRGRVTNETAPVKRLAPDHPVWSSPHVLGPEVWEGWVQERGLYFPEAWDEGWTPLVELADPNESAQRGALLVKRHGRGRVTYAALSFFRQLPAGVPGAYRLLINLIAHD